MGDYLQKNRDVYSPLVSEKDNNNYMMLAYYRNPLNQIFFNEGIVIVALQSLGGEAAWKTGITMDELFKRCVFLSRLLDKEEVQKDKITEKNRDFFDHLIKLMIARRILYQIPESVSPSSSVALR